MTATVFRLADWDDLPALCQLIQLAFRPLASQLPSRPTALDETVASLTGHLASGSQIFLAEREGQLLACLLVLPPQNGLAEVKRVCAHPDWQGHGLGSALLEYSEKQLRKQGVEELILSTRRQLPGNLRFYQKLGYQEMERQPYPAGIDDERVVMRKNLFSAASHL
ncbi:GNAT family N-acetyltransferase [Chromobacterium sp. IIBBL 290-4]|uniref:GNAT family N-acetyltransferase n=1 Tax=Chromobacterium sp. IIBBL 290-4 TaxID=2953890 RepID=UPI0020B8F9C8|nr:GNAT family N-acetyltransferase [Chromobacterium sp. IIBBL 290-4]UTH74498.1 GNAT family N-acetyltransferase [Chromobacterium sp. IIBBL 290-4]